MKQESDKQFKRKILQYKYVIYPTLTLVVGLIIWFLKNRSSETASSIKINPNQQQTATQNTTVNVNLPEDTVNSKEEPKVIIVYKDIPEKSKRTLENPSAKVKAKNNISGGTFNAPVNVGDTYVNSEAELKVEDKFRLMELIKEEIGKHDIKIKCLSMNMANGSNGHKLYKQIKDYLLEQGYRYEGTSTSFYTEVPEGVGINITNSCVEITIGRL